MTKERIQYWYDTIEKLRIEILGSEPEKTPLNSRPIAEQELLLATIEIRSALRHMERTEKK